MATHDVNGVEYAKLPEVKGGDKLRVDDGFTCMKEGGIKIVHADPDGSLWVECDEGRHYLDGQNGFHEDDKDHLIGMYPVRDDA